MVESRESYLPHTLSAISSIVGNAGGRVRRESMNGRDYLVAPLTLIVSGVLNGSKGALFYPAEEIARDPSAWNGMPLTIYHPTSLDGSPISGRDPKVIERQGVGYVYGAHYTSNGHKLKAEGWFDIEHLRRIHTDTLSQLQSGRPIELSTGLFTDNYPASRGSTHNTPYGPRPYDYIARNYRPDHVAILPNQIGACSIADGCGVLVNKDRDGRPLANRDACHPDRGCECSDEEDREDCEREEGTMNIESTFFQRFWHWVTNQGANPNQPRSQVTGRLKKFGAGVGKGETHEAAQAGYSALGVCDEDMELGRDASRQLKEEGRNPASWVEDEDTWEKAKEAALKSQSDTDSDAYWGTVTHIYKNMGGKVKSKSEDGKTHNRDFTQSHRDRLPHEDFAGPHQSFPIVTQEDVHSASKLIGHSADPEGTKKRIISIAKRKGLSLPDEWKDSSSDSDTPTGNATSMSMMPNKATVSGGMTRVQGQDKTTSKDGRDMADIEREKDPADSDDGYDDDEYSEDHEGQKPVTGNKGMTLRGEYTTLINLDTDLLTNSELGVNKEFDTDEERKAAFAAMADSGGVSTKGWTKESHTGRGGAEKGSGRGTESHSGKGGTESHSGKAGPSASSGGGKSAALKAAASEASAHAVKRTAMAKKAGGGSDRKAREHRKAWTAHLEAATAHEAAGSHETAGHHLKAADEHLASAKHHEGRMTGNQRVDLDIEDRDILIERLITTNCACDGDRGNLSYLSDSTLEGMYMGSRHFSRNAAGSVEAGGGGQYGEGAPKKGKVNFESSSDDTLDTGEVDSAAEDGIEDDDQESGSETLRKQRQGSSSGTKKSDSSMMSTNEWMARAPAEIRAAVHNAMEIEKAERIRLVRLLVANVQDPQRQKAIAAKLLTRDLQDLRERLELMGASVPAPQFSHPTPLFNGAAGSPMYPSQGVTANQATDDDVLPLPTINWKDRGHLGHGEVREAE